MSSFAIDRPDPAGGAVRSHPLPGSPVADDPPVDLDRESARRTWPAVGSHGVVIPFDIWLRHVRLARTQDPAHLPELVEHYRGFAAGLARRFHRDTEPLEDLVQVAMEYLVRELWRFEPERGLPFMAYAGPTIVGTLKTHYRDHGWAIRVTRRVHELAAPVRRANDELMVELGRSPLVSEVAESLGLTEEEVLEAQEASGARATASLDALQADDGGSRHLGQVDPALAGSDHHLMLQEAIGHLTPLESHLLRLYFVDDLSQTDVARTLGISQMQVSRRLARTLDYLRTRMME